MSRFQEVGKILYFHDNGKHSRNFKLQLFFPPRPTHLVSEDLPQPESSVHVLTQLRKCGGKQPGIQVWPSSVSPHRLWTARVVPPNCSRLGDARAEFGHPPPTPSSRGGLPQH